MGDNNATQPQSNQEIGRSSALSKENMVSSNVNEEEGHKEQVLAQTEDTARLRLMGISQALPEADGAVDMEDEKHLSEELRPTSSPGRPDTEEEIRRKLMSISSSDVACSNSDVVQPLPMSGQPVAG